jgi:hypothetical protein
VAPFSLVQFLNLASKERGDGFDFCVVVCDFGFHVLVFLVFLVFGFVLEEFRQRVSF